MKISKSTLTEPLHRISKIGLLNRIGNPGIVLLKSERDYLEVSSFSSEISSLESVKCEGDLGASAIHGGKLLDFLKFAKDDVSFSRDGGKLLVDSGSALKLPIVPKFDIPKSDQKFESVAVNCLDLADSIKAVSWASDPTQERNICRSVAISLTPLSMKCYAFTGKILAKHSRPAICGDFCFFLPAKHADEFSDALKRDGAVFKISTSQLRVEFEGGWLNVTRSTDTPHVAQFESAIEGGNDCGEADLSELLNACRSSMPFANLDPCAQIEFGETTKFKSLFDSSYEFNSELPIKITRAFKIYSDCRYLIQSLSKHSGKVQMREDAPIKLVLRSGFLTTVNSLMKER